MRRMDRYNDENPIMPKRSLKNQELYQNVVNTKTSNITSLSDVTNANAFEIKADTGEKKTTRESYQQMKKYAEVENVPRVKKELDDFNYLYKTSNEKRIYDINSVLEEARKNRKEQDELENKRKLKNTSYNILADLNMEELQKYREEKKNRTLGIEPASEIRELIDTITSKTLAGEIDQATSVDLLSDLMATSMMDKVKNPNEIDEEQNEISDEPKIVEVTEEIEIEIDGEKPIKIEENITEEEIKESTKEMDSVKELYDVIEEKISESQRLFSKSEIADALERKEKEIEEKNTTTENEEKETTNLENADKDFYTRSMDLSDQDFEMSDDFKEKSLPLPVKILIFIIIAAIIAATAYFIYLKLI